MNGTATTTILNVDDTEAARYAKSRTLRHAGFEVVDAVSGRDALAQMEALRPALVLLDVRLPDISGIEVCKEIKRRWPTTMVLQTSATFTSAADRTRGLEGGADAYLIQPIDPDELVAAVRALLRLHAAESSTRALNESLERRIEERTRALHQSNIRLIEQIAQRERAEAVLVQSQKMEAIGQLTGSMAHDFNNILASMVGYIHLVQRMAGDAKLSALLDKALAAAERGKQLTLRLLAFSRSNDLVTGPTDVRALLQGMRDWLQQAVESAITLELDVPAEGELVALTDANQLELAMLNLVLNARDAMPQGGRIRIEAAAQELAQVEGELGAGAYVVITVADTGTGMAPEVAAKAFDPFFTTKPVGRGTGLGLAQVANVARLSRGGARIDSEPGRGTRVALWLAAGSGAATAPAPARALPEDLAGRGERVLVIDDEADIRRTMGELLRGNGYEVLSAADGGAALSAYADFLPQMVLLDLGLPGLSGIEVARRLRQIDPKLPIVFVSGHADRELLWTAVPGARLLRKPFQSEELYAEVRRGLDEKDGEAPGAQTD
ncbi:response regulator [Azohydromonas caseinilytica]|uniref:histidine kinase n=1 Tax=Azohydromonas caseinilytica TaxID=2728836 RepID=A0A848FFE3_9BURK|nr:response regulator [Azohydromonas caseinilytica]NML16870.1 response regulator [Azohydromonas caseinilytica]